MTDTNKQNHEENTQNIQDAAYKKVTGRDVSLAGSERFKKIKDELNISNSDALWGVIYILEMYIRIIEDYNTKMQSAVFEAIREYGKRGGSINIYNNDKDKGLSIERVMLWLGIMLFISLAAFVSGVCVGSAGSPPAWITDNKSGALNIFLGIPAGWLFFIIIMIPCGFILHDKYYIIMPLKGKERKIEIAKFYGVMLLAITGIIILVSTLITNQ
jgi:hypothetical protein